MFAHARDTVFYRQLIAFLVKIKSNSAYIHENYPKAFWGSIAIIVGLPIIMITAFLFLSTSTLSVRVDGFHWTRTVEIERYQTVHTNSWYSHPSDAYNITSCYCYHYTNNWTTCNTRDKKGNCTSSTYHSEAVYDWFYAYSIDRWLYDYSLVNYGSQQAAILWPEAIPFCPTLFIGCKRENKRYATYSVSLVDNRKETYQCDYELERWLAINQDYAYRLVVGQYIHIPRCDSLKTG